jgi:hypothetical protein
MALSLLVKYYRQMRVADNGSFDERCADAAYWKQNCCRIDLVGLPNCK